KTARTELVFHTERDSDPRAARFLGGGAELGRPARTDLPFHEIEPRADADVGRELPERRVAVHDHRHQRELLLREVPAVLARRVDARILLGPALLRLRVIEVEREGEAPVHPGEDHAGLDAHEEARVEPAEREDAADLRVAEEAPPFTPAVWVVRLVELGGR